MGKVAVLGGGVAGLTAADELSRRHFKVDVFERRPQFGGKARSFPSGPVDGLGQLPAEHGFRFIPGFYWHLPNTMKDIPYKDGASVYDNLVEGKDLGLLRAGRKGAVLPMDAWGILDPDGVRLNWTGHPFVDNFGLTPDDMIFLARKLTDLLATCRERRLAECEIVSWLEYCGALERVQATEYRAMMVALTRSLVAARAEEMSARTGGDILLQLQLAQIRPDGRPDRLLNGPTSDVWIEPWCDKLRQAGVDFYPNTEVTGFDLAGSRLAGVRVRDRASQGAERPAGGYDWYVCALPVEVMQELVDDTLATAAPTLANLRQLTVRWMNGFMLYLRQDDAMVQGHSIYVDSPWALTSVSQAQFWPQHQSWKIPGKVEGILSVDISDWTTAGPRTGKAAQECTPDEIRTEVVGQLRDHSNGMPWEPSLADANIAGYFIDPDIYWPNPKGASVNLEPLLINKAGSWSYRPDCQTEIDNLLLAADYVRTATDLATMEGANEAAKRAVNYILSLTGSGEPLCPLKSPEEPPFLAFLRYIDRNAFRARHQHAYAKAHDMLAALGIEH
jgi:uncharacterized protein with NAD-binding domain and iron-sulfur cluster